MPKQRTTVIDMYQFDELDDCAKERARDWYRGCTESDDFDYTLDDCAEALKALGFRLGNRYNKRTIYWGTNPIDAAFDATWSAQRFAPDKLLADRPTDKELHRITAELATVARAYPNAHGSCTRGRNRNQTAEFDANVEDCEREAEESAQGTADTFRTAVTDLAHWVATTINAEYEYQYSAECVDESIRCNEYEFDINGKRI